MTSVLLLTLLKRRKKNKALNLLVPPRWPLLLDCSCSLGAEDFPGVLLESCMRLKKAPVSFRLALKCRMAAAAWPGAVVTCKLS